MNPYRVADVPEPVDIDNPQTPIEHVFTRAAFIEPGEDGFRHIWVEYELWFELLAHHALVDISKITEDPLPSLRFSDIIIHGLLPWESTRTNLPRLDNRASSCYS